MAYGNNGRRAASLFDRESEPAMGFLNLYVPNKAGGESKVGFIAMKGQGVAQRQLIDAITACQGDEQKIAAIVAKLVVKFNPADSGVQIDV